MDEKIYKITSIDIGSTNSQMAQTYVTISNETKKHLKEPEKEVQYLLRDNGEINIPTILLRKSDLTENQKMQIEMNKDYLAGHAASELYFRHYGLKLVSEFKKDFFCSEEAKENEVAKEKYESAKQAILEFLTFLKQRESMEEQKYTNATEITILTHPVRCTQGERDTLTQLATAAGWKNVVILDEARSVLKYALGKKSSPLINTLNQMTLLQDLYVLIMDIGGSTTDLILTKIRPDGEGGFFADTVKQWPPNVGETDPLGGINIDKKFCHWFLDNGFLVPELATRAIQSHGYYDFRKFKENNMRAIQNDFEIQQINELIPLMWSPEDSNLRPKVNYHESPTKINRDIYLKEIAWEYLTQLQSAIRNLLKEAGVSEQELGCIVTAGGGTKLYGIREMLLGELDLPEPLQFSKIQKNPAMLVQSSEETSAVCALGNVVPLPHVSFQNHALSDFVMKVKIYNAPAGSTIGWYTAHADRPKIPSDFKCVFYKSYELISEGTILPQTKTIEESFIVYSDTKSVFAYILEIFSRKDGKLYFQRAWSDYSSRTLKALLRGTNGQRNGKYVIGVTFGKNFTISITPKIKIDGNWGFSSSTRKLNG